MSTSTNVEKISTPQQTASSFLQSPAVASKFEQILGSKEKANQFVMSALAVVNNNDLLKKASPQSVYTACLVASSMGLPINNSLGYAYIVPYRKQDGTSEAQFQLGYKGLIQLAHRTRQFKTINSIEVREGEVKSLNRITGEIILGEPTSSKVVGYLAYFELLNGFNKSLYMQLEDINKHSLKYSQTAKKGYGVWKDEFEAMAKKTVLKLLLGRYAPMSIEVQNIVTYDQAVVKENEDGTLEAEYVDNSNTIVIEEADVQPLNL